MSDQLPLSDIMDEFSRAPAQLRLPLLLEYSRRVPELPDHLSSNPELLEQVHECQTPFFVRAEPGEGDAVILYFQAPEDAPTTRGFAGVLASGLGGQSRAAILATPDDFHERMGLAELISPLRLRGMSAILARIKRQVAKL